ncbi:kinase-like domain-containing protein [Lentinula edodes]|nr:kinase-like domain-containing protein [Lentinula edodes]
MLALQKCILNVASVFSIKELSFPRKVTLDSQWSQNNWLALKDFFQSEGYTLWDKSGSTLFQPNDDKPRGPDGFAYENPSGAIGQHYFTSCLGKHWPARTPDCQDVLLVLLNPTELEILRRVATNEAALIDQNHTLPLLWTITYERFIFGVFPLVGLDFTFPWFATMDQTFEAIHQILEGVVFLHDNLIAHRDLFIGNILPSRRVSRCSDPDLSSTRYYFIDFENAVHFSKDSDPATRTVVGPPVPWAKYGRPSPPEMQQKFPYCPFRADIWQVGGCLYQLVLDAEPYIPEIVELFRTTMADKPDDRPSVRETLTTFQKLLEKVPSEVKKMSFDIFLVEHGKMALECLEEMP